MSEEGNSGGGAGNKPKPLVWTNMQYLMSCLPQNVQEHQGGEQGSVNKP